MSAGSAQAKKLLHRSEGCVPDNLLHVGERSELREGDLAHGLADVEKARERFFLLDEIVVAGLAGRLIGTGGDKGVGVTSLGEAGVDKAKARVCGDEHEGKLRGKCV